MPQFGNADLLLKLKPILDKDLRQRWKASLARFSDRQPIQAGFIEIQPQEWRADCSHAYLVKLRTASYSPGRKGI
ncbi:MAG: hypothetical protein JO071_10895 [Deltaproteobacteria bacterium]|nr:hypothetical protein [Deltaproteobacteria bacterium]